jgi:hypothetical protein
MFRVLRVGSNRAAVHTAVRASPDQSLSSVRDKEPAASSPPAAHEWRTPAAVPAYQGWDDNTEKKFRQQQHSSAWISHAKEGGVPLPNMRDGICDSALDLVGDTPIVRLTRLSRKLGLDPSIDLVAKCEFFSAGGSVKDRVGLRMVREAQVSGRIKKGDVLVEPTSGNTGIGLCLAAAVEGYKVIITMPLKMSGEKLNTMKALGAEVVRTPTEAAWDAEDSVTGLWACVRTRRLFLLALAMASLSYFKALFVRPSEIAYAVSVCVFVGCVFGVSTFRWPRTWQRSRPTRTSWTST